MDFLSCNWEHVLQNVQLVDTMTLNYRAASFVITNVWIVRDPKTIAQSVVWKTTSFCMMVNVYKIVLVVSLKTLVKTYVLHAKKSV